MAFINCPECGTQISDRANACPQCGCPLNTYYAAPQYVQNQNVHTSLYPKIREFSEAVNSVYVLSILSLIFCMGIGFIFMIINLVKFKKIPVITEQITSPTELAEYQAAERKLKTARTLTGIALILLGVSIFAGMIIGVMSVNS